ncbi:DinB family protein [Ornithinimicrobium humiphilum]|uniref:Uncharacterized protein DUF664 n=1 Tax=Ornithinimicrobium humiphilum TaxID=125288 RepID=A0A543KNN4_9MICO|nr:DinB family protein [Ornithinimicrobium humiphilum]TQM96672.1 uncharacterized protein DUF664 [Ornithinimicrobium humiphilum]
MTSYQPVEVSLSYLQRARDALVWKVEGLSPYDMRRPLTPTGTNLLGLVKHVALTEHGYLGILLGSPLDLPRRWEDETPDADFWVSPDQDAATVLDAYRRIWVNSDATVRRLGADAPVEVPPWPPERRSTSVGAVLTHVVAETHRHAGHADILRETIDGAAGLQPSFSNLSEGDAERWRRHVEHLEAQARAARA